MASRRFRMGHEYHDPQGFCGRLDRQASSTFELIWWTCDAVRCTRTIRHVSADDHPAVPLLFTESGRATIDDGRRRSVVGARDVIVLPADRPVEIAHGRDFSASAIMMPLSTADGVLSLPDGTSLAGGSGLAAIANSMVRSARAERDNLDAASFDAVCRRVVELVALAADEATDVGTAPTSRAIVVGAIRQYVRDHATEADLTGRNIAAALGWSLRYVQVVLREAGTTPTGLIRSERLALARSRLRNPAYRRWSVGQIGRGCGFRTASSFSNAFRSEFGVTARETRQQG